MIENFNNYQEFKLSYEFTENKEWEYRKRMNSLHDKLSKNLISEKYYKFEAKQYQDLCTKLKEHKDLEHKFLSEYGTNKDIIRMIMNEANSELNDYKENDEYILKIIQAPIIFNVNSSNLLLSEHKNIGCESTILLVKKSIFKSKLYELFYNRSLLDDYINDGTIILLDKLYDYSIDTQEKLDSYLLEKRIHLSAIQKLNPGLEDKIKEKLFQKYKENYNKSKPKIRKKEK